jgi:hypothetical protein
MRITNNGMDKNFLRFIGVILVGAAAGLSVGLFLAYLDTEMRQDPPFTPRESVDGYERVPDNRIQ